MRSVGFDPRCARCGAEIPMGSKKGHCTNPQCRLQDLESDLRARALVACIEVIQPLKKDREKRLVVRSLMEIYEVHGDWEEEEEE